MYRFRSWYYLVIPVLIFTHLFVAPFTKVEESFNIQAIHDILQYGVPVSNVHNKLMVLFDHMTFSGAVPRTFVGALVTAAFSRPIILLGGLKGMAQQMTARSLLGLLNASALTHYTRAVRVAYGDQTALWFIALQASQFHTLYYASRTLPNSFAFCLSTFALAVNLPNPTSPLKATKRFRLALYLLTLAAVIFRGEIALLLASQAAYSLLQIRGISSQIAFVRYAVIPAVLAAAFVGLILTVGIDTYFWQSPTLLWPEASAFLSNVLPKEGHAGASAWGTSPWYWYFTSAIPRLIGPHSVLLTLWAVSFATQRTAILDNLVPSLAYTIVYSILPHKETRFLFPVVPSFTLAAALSASYLCQRRRLLLRWATIAFACIIATAGLVSHLIMLPLSAQGYPGGHALQTLHNYHANNPLPEYLNAHSQAHINVHLTNLALQTGVTLFLEQPVVSSTALTATGFKARPQQWIYDKTSNSTAFQLPSFWSQFDYVVVENPAMVQSVAAEEWAVIAETKALRRVLFRNVRDVLRTGRLPSGRWSEWGLETRLYIMARKFSSPT